MRTTILIQICSFFPFLLLCKTRKLSLFIFDRGDPMRVLFHLSISFNNFIHTQHTLFLTDNHPLQMGDLQKCFICLTGLPLPLSDLRVCPKSTSTWILNTSHWVLKHKTYLFSYWKSALPLYIRSSHLKSSSKNGITGCKSNCLSGICTYIKTSLCLFENHKIMGRGGETWKELGALKWMKPKKEAIWLITTSAAKCKYLKLSWSSKSNSPGHHILEIALSGNC